MNLKSLYSNNLIKYCDEKNLIISDSLLLEPNSYTCVSSAWNSFSWLDHVISTNDMHISLIDITIDYSFILSDHHPLLITVRQDNTHLVVSNDSKVNKRIKWNNLNKKQILLYKQNTKFRLNRLITSINSNNNVNFSESVYNTLLSILLSESDVLHIKLKTNFKNLRSEWTSDVKKYHSIARSHYLIWRSVNNPRYGIVYDNMVMSRRKFKYELRTSKAYYSRIKANDVAFKLINDRNSFWKIVSSKLKKNLSIQNNIDNVHGLSDIVKFWFNHYSCIFNRCKDGHYPYQIVDINEIVYTDRNEISSIIKTIKKGKNVGPDGLSVEHINYADNTIIDTLVLLINNMLLNSYFPSKLIESYILPIIKNKNKRTTDSANYRPICISNVICKIIEKVIYNRIYKLLSTHDNQFGFKAKLGTEMCVFSLKQLINDYKNNNTNMFVAFLDASKAFNNISHNILFERLRNKNVPIYLINFLNYWYRNQRIYIKWGSYNSDSFSVANGVRQGGILSPLLYNIYTDPMIGNLNSIKTGYCINGNIINNLCYADDTTLFSPSLSGLQLLIDCCQKFANSNKITYNIEKSVILPIYYNKSHHNPIKLRIGNTCLRVVTAYKYLGHWISDNLSDEMDINCNIKRLYTTSYSLSNRFRNCSKYVCILLFKTFCSNMYLCSLWDTDNAYFKKIQVAYNNAYRISLGYKPRCSASEMYLYDNVDNIIIKLRKSYYSLYNRIKLSDNSIIKMIYLYNVSRPSSIFKTWCTSLFF